MSFASSAALPAACVPATAQLLLPTNGSSSSSAERRAACSEPPCARRPAQVEDFRARNRARPATCRRRSAHPTRCRADAGSRNSGGGSTSRSCARASSSAPLESLRLRYIENATSTESSTRHGAGCVRSSVYSHGRAPALVKREVDARGIGVEQLRDRRRRCPARSLRAMRRKPWMRNFSSMLEHAACRAAPPARRRRRAASDPSGRSGPGRARSRSRTRGRGATRRGSSACPARRARSSPAPAAPARRSRRRAAAGSRAA